MEAGDRAMPERLPNDSLAQQHQRVAGLRYTNQTCIDFSLYKHSKVYCKTLAIFAVPEQAPRIIVD